MCRRPEDLQINNKEPQVNGECAETVIEGYAVGPEECHAAVEVTELLERMRADVRLGVRQKLAADLG